MSHLVASVAPQAGAHTVKAYAGFGILGADIPASGDTAGSPVLNDGISSTAEYYWRVETLPDSGTLTIYPDLSYLLVGASDGVHPWVYRLFENGIDVGTATVTEQVGVVTHLISVANSQQANSASAVAIRQTHKIGVASSQQVNTTAPGSVKQTHKIGIASSQQANQASAGSVSQSSTTFVSPANSQQVNQASAIAIRQTHRIGIASSQQANVASAGSVSQSSTTFVAVANSQQVNQASAIAIRQTHRIGIANSQQANVASPVGISQSGTFFVAAANSQQHNQASPVAIGQTHLISVANSQQVNRCSSVRVSDGSVLPITDVCTLTISHQPVMVIYSGVSLPNARAQEMKMQSNYWKGGAVRLSMQAVNPDGSAVDPLVIRLSMRYASGAIATLTYGQDLDIIRDRPGFYHADVPLTASGQLYYRWETDMPLAAAEGNLPVAAGRFA